MMAPPHSSPSIDSAPLDQTTSAAVRASVTLFFVAQDLEALTLLVWRKSILLTWLRNSFVSFVPGSLLLRSSACLWLSDSVWACPTRPDPMLTLALGLGNSAFNVLLAVVRVVVSRLASHLASKRACALCNSI